MFGQDTGSIDSPGIGVTRKADYPGADTSCGFQGFDSFLLIGQGAVVGF
jgi:hypothetical protein